MATVPTIPVEPAGAIAASADLNAWSSAASWLAQSASGKRPVFFLMASATQSLTTSFAAINFSNTAAVFKDNDGGWAGANPGRYTIQTAGYWSIDWAVSAASGAGKLAAYAQVTTTASNPYNPSVTVQFQYCHADATSGGQQTVQSSGGLIPIYLFPGDVLQIQASVFTAVSTYSGDFPHLSGQWVSA